MKTFYDEIGSRYKMYPEKMEYDQFKITDDDKHYTELLVRKKSEIQQNKVRNHFLDSAP